MNHRKTEITDALLFPLVIALIVAMWVGLGALLAEADGREDWYEYGDVSMASHPVLVDSTNAGTLVTFQIPNYGPGVMVGFPSLKGCQKWREHGRLDWAALPKPTIDKYLTIVPGPTNYLTGEYVYILGDLSPTPRQQWICPRLPYVRTYGDE